MIDCQSIGWEATQRCRVYKNYFIKPIYHQLSCKYNNPSSMHHFMNALEYSRLWNTNQTIKLVLMHGRNHQEHHFQ